ncbi:hypothetical protein CEH05_20065 [Halobacillus halophilus]|uniref:hypothetical protein n=1 Tax=Halobacillus halophilus TaxID=1570 RepID=UPI0006866A0D|nr:hypothetical protein [Halobacillus halophilus]ASF41336.1 hypothetical protein CEH05_20065 [Halobacillus halophilus]
MKLLGLKPLSIFDPLSSSYSNSSRTVSRPLNHSKNEWNPEAKELYNAINLLVIYWGNRPLDDFLAEFLADLRKYKNYQPYFKRVKSVNTILKNKKKSTKDILDILKVDNPNIRSFSFCNLKKRLEDNGLTSYLI